MQIRQIIKIRKTAAGFADFFIIIIRDLKIRNPLTIQEVMI